MQNISVEMKNITKSFGALKANENVNLLAKGGEVHALLGENGAGKSTLMNMLSGIYTPDSGSIYINGKKTEFTSPKDAINRGIGMIHQHFKLVDVMTAQENIMLGQTGKNKKGVIEKEIKTLSEKYGLDIELEKKVYEMSVSEKQTLEILKVLHTGANILILDEPTAVLTPQEISKLFVIIRNMTEQGCAVIIITHKLNEVMEISNKITVLRKGKSIETVETKSVDTDYLIEMMVGKRVELEIGRKEIEDKKELLKLDGVTVLNDEGKPKLSNANFSVFSHEIIGVAGVANSGQKELCEVIAGLMKAKKGRIFFNGENIVGKTPRDIIRLGIRMGFIPEDRLGMGLVPNMGIVNNIILKDYQTQKGMLLRKAPSVAKANKIVDKLEIQTPNIYTPIKKLSGGNIQKVLLGREIDANPKLLITAYPVRGLDIGSSYRIYDLLNEQKEKGVGVLFIGEDLDVLMALCDRILVLCDGRIVDIVSPKEYTKEDVGLLMTGTQVVKNKDIEEGEKNV